MFQSSSTLQSATVDTVTVDLALVGLQDALNEVWHAGSVYIRVYVTSVCAGIKKKYMFF